MEALKSIQSSPFISGLKTRLSLLGDSLMGDGDSATPGLLRRRKTKRGSSIFPHLSPFSEPEQDKGPTLAEQAEEWRRLNPQSWRKRQEDRERWIQESFNVYEKNPVLEALFQKQEEELQERKEKERRRLLLPRKIVVEIKFGMPEAQAQPVRRLSIRRKSDIQFPELCITVVRASNLFNHLAQDEDKSEKCCVRALLKPDKGGSDKNKSSYRFLNRTGMTRWDHTFKFPGMAESFPGKYVQLKVMGQTRSGEKPLIGTCVLGSARGSVEMEDNCVRNLTYEEYAPFERCFIERDKPLTLYLKLYPEDWEGMKGITIRQLEPTAPSPRRGSVFGASKKEKRGSISKESKETDATPTDEPEEKNQDDVTSKDPSAETGPADESEEKKQEGVTTSSEDLPTIVVPSVGGLQEDSPPQSPALNEEEDDMRPKKSSLTLPTEVPYTEVKQQSPDVNGSETPSKSSADGKSSEDDTRSGVLKEEDKIREETSDVSSKEDVGEASKTNVDGEKSLNLSDATKEKKDVDGPKSTEESSSSDSQKQKVKDSNKSGSVSEKSKDQSKSVVEEVSSSNEAKQRSEGGIQDIKNTPVKDTKEISDETKVIQDTSGKSNNSKTIKVKEEVIQQKSNDTSKKDDESKKASGITSTSDEKPVKDVQPPVQQSGVVQKKDPEKSEKSDKTETSTKDVVSTAEPSSKKDEKNDEPLSKIDTKSKAAAGSKVILVKDGDKSTPKITENIQESKTSITKEGDVVQIQKEEKSEQKEENIIATSAAQKAPETSSENKEDKDASKTDVPASEKKETSSEADQKKDSTSKESPDVKKKGMKKEESVSEETEEDKKSPGGKSPFGGFRQRRKNVKKKPKT